MKIIAFPFAGGNKSSYNAIFKNTGLDYVTLNYPGRGARIKEPLVFSINALVDDMLAQVKEVIDTTENYIIYGHSMGALIGFLICKRIEELQLKKPLQLVVSGHKGPKYPRKTKITNLPDKEFWDVICKYGGVPAAMNKHKELISFFIPILKADFICLETYEHNIENASKLTIPVDVFYGAEENMKVHEAEAWKEETEKNVTVNELQGDHFFIYEQKDVLVNYFKDYKNIKTNIFL